MADYIDREKIFSIWRSMPAPASVTSLAAAISQTPAADVVEVRHGRWVPEIHHTYLPVEYDDAGGPILHEYTSYRCSLCGREETKEEPYCHCGARMDKEDEHEAD